MKFNKNPIFERKKNVSLRRTVSSLTMCSVSNKEVRERLGCIRSCIAKAGSDSASIDIYIYIKKEDAYS